MRAVLIVWVAFLVSVAQAKSFLVETENKGDNSDDMTNSHEATGMAAKGIFDVDLLFFFSSFVI